MDTLPPIPDVCAACRQAMAQDAPEHHALAELLSFDPVPVRAHCNNWTPAHQRGFIAALAITGSIGRAARAVGRYPFGAERLRKARGGTSFSMAWDAALDHCRHVELAVMGAHLKALKEEADADRLHPPRSSCAHRGTAPRSASAAATAIIAMTRPTRMGSWTKRWSASPPVSRTPAAIPVDYRP